MKESEPAKTLDGLQRKLRPFLQRRGFRVKRRTFNRTTADGLTQVVNFQMGTFDPPGTTYIPGLRENLYGKFTVNVGVHVPEVAQVHGGYRTRDFVREYGCCVRARLGQLGPEHEDRWWEIRDDEQIAAELELRLEQDAFPFLARFESRDMLLNEFSQMIDEGVPGFVGGGPPRIICAIILAARGQHKDARELLADQVRNSQTHPGHAEYVRTLTGKLGLKPLGV